MNRTYTAKNLKTDSALGLLNGLFFSSINSIYTIALNKPYAPNATIKEKSLAISRKFFIQTSKLSLVFLGANIVFGYTKKKEFESHYAFALAVGAGYLLLTLLKV